MDAQNPRSAIAGVNGVSLDYQSAVGQANTVTVSLSGSEYTIRDTGAAIAPLAGCSAVSANTVKCDATGIKSIQVDTQDMDDTVSQTSPTASTLRGGPGADTLSGGPGADTLDGGPGVDLATYMRRSTSVAVTLDSTANDGAAGEGDNVQTENVAGSMAADVLSGSAGPNLLQGRAGNDVLNGYAGDDMIDGSGGNDRMTGGAGADLLNGNSGVDTADYSARARSVIVTLSRGRNDGGAGERDNVRAEVVIGGTAADQITGDVAANTLIGGPGDDTLDGGLGADALRGLDGNDILLARDGIDDISLECDGGTTAGSADNAVVDTTDPAPAGCESVSRR
jgi:Ca2+-binding RTX toxin-like protein